MKLTRRQLRKLIIEGLSNTPRTINVEEHLSNRGTWKVVITHYDNNRFVGEIHESGYDPYDRGDQYGVAAKSRRASYHGFGVDGISKLEVIRDLQDQITEGAPLFMNKGQNAYDELTNLLRYLEYQA